jgi:glycosyltransferase involved in cell wall biosynthesis
MRYQSDFIKTLPGCVKKSIAWRAAPSPNADFAAYDAIICNFQSILAGYRENGWRAEYFLPAHDPEMDKYAVNNKRPIDVLFVGGYSRHHRHRVKTLESVASLRKQYKIVYHLDRSRLTRLAESPLGYLLPLGSYRRPADIRAVDETPIFGRDLYEAISRSKIVLNGAVDMAGSDRGNMRCFEAMGCGALMVSDAGIYPNEMADGRSMLTYQDSNDARDIISEVLANPERLRSLASSGSTLIRDRYSKERQWSDFESLLSRL